MSIINMMMALPFDAHNHVHMGPSNPVRCFDPFRIGSRDEEVAIGGMAVMSTHPRDFDRVVHIAERFKGSSKTVKCFGVHPWFVSDLGEDDLVESEGVPQWLSTIEELLMSHPDAIVGEIGLDGFHFDGRTGDLAAPLDRQAKVFRSQMELAAKYGRSVSVHTVQCFGTLMEELSQLKKRKQMPPKVYFHAFGGKSGTIDQLVALCGSEVGRVYFGFAPIVNFRSPKTTSVIQKVGIERLVLETDHEDAKFVSESMRKGIELIAQALELSEEQVIQQTTKNAIDLYGIPIS